MHLLASRNLRAGLGVLVRPKRHAAACTVPLLLKTGRLKLR